MKRVRSRRHAAQTLIAFALGFALLQAAFHYPLAIVFPQMRDVEYGKKLVALRQIHDDKPANRPLIVTLGSSLTAMGVRPGVLPERDEPGRPICYNFGINAGGPVVQLVCLKRMLNNHIRPDLVLIEVNPFFLTPESNRLQHGEFLPAARALRSDLRTLSHFHDDPSAFQTAWGLRQIVPWASHRKNLMLWADPNEVLHGGFLANAWLYTDRWGWETVPPAQLQSHANKHADPAWQAGIRIWWRDLTSRPAEAKAEAALIELAELCRRKKIPALAVISPECSQIRESYHPDRARRMTELLEKMGGTVVDARDWVPDSGFLDGLHQSPDGATAYTLRLEREVFRRYFPLRSTASR